jgi:hypothetical protein
MERWEIGCYSIDNYVWIMNRMKLEEDEANRSSHLLSSIIIFPKDMHMQMG